MIFLLVAMTRLEKCCITSAYLQWLCHSGERRVARGPLVIIDWASFYIYLFAALNFMYPNHMNILDLFTLLAAYFVDNDF